MVTHERMANVSSFLETPRLSKRKALRNQDVRHALLAALISVVVIGFILAGVVFALAASGDACATEQNFNQVLIESSCPSLLPTSNLSIGIAAGASITAQSFATGIVQAMLNSVHSIRSSTAARRETLAAAVFLTGLALFFDASLIIASMMQRHSLTFTTMVLTVGIGSPLLAAFHGIRWPNLRKPPPVSACAA